MNFSRLFALNCALLILVGLSGCGSSDGSRELEKGLAAYEVRDLIKAEKFISESLTRAPQDVGRILYLARIKLDLGKMPEVHKLIAQAQSLSGADADVRLFAAQLAWHDKDYARARTEFSKLAEDARVSAPIRAQALAGLGVVEMSDDRPHHARVAFLQATRLDARNASAWYHLGLLYRDAFQYLEIALQQFDVFIHLEKMADVRVQKTQTNLIPALKEAIGNNMRDRPGVSKRNSSACATALAKAETAVKKGSFKNARLAYQEALTADPLSYPAAKGLAECWEKTDTTKAGQEKALENYRVACLLRPSAVKTFLTAGALATKLGLQVQAVEFYSRAVAANPTSFDAIDGLIRALRKTGGRAAEAQAYQKYREAISRKK